MLACKLADFRPYWKRRDTELWHSPAARHELLRRERDAPESTIHNVLNLPDNDGILLTTGNLEDVTMQESSMTGLNVKNDLYVHGWMQFGSGGHTGSCGWTECSDAAHVQTNGIQLPTEDLVTGWEQRDDSICSEAELGLPIGFLATPSEWLTLNNSCWESKFGGYCFQLQESTVEHCLGACTNQSCSLVFVSTFNLAHLISTVKDELSGQADVQGIGHFTGTSDSRIPVESFPVPCRSDPLKPGQELCLYVFRKAFDEASTPGRQRLIEREYIAGGMDITLAAKLEWARQNLSDTRDAQRDVYDTFRCFNRACNLEGAVYTDISEEVTTQYCIDRGLRALQATSQIDFHGHRLSCDDIEAPFMPCAEPDGEVEGEEAEEEAATTPPGMCLKLFPWQDTFPDLMLTGPAVPSIEALQMVYDALQDLRRQLLTIIAVFSNEMVLERKLAELEGRWNPEYERRPHLWQKEIGNSTRFRWFGYCESAALSQGASKELTCRREGSVITAVEFAAFGTAGGNCGKLQAGSCAEDVTSALNSQCAGKSSCTWRANAFYFEKWNQKPAHCRAGGAAPELHFQVRCSNGPFLTLLDGELGVSYGAVADAEEEAMQGWLYKPSRMAQIRLEAVALALDFDTRVRCALARASPPMVQAHMCSPQTNYDATTYVYKGFEADLKLLLESEGSEGQSTVLRFQSLRESNESVSETRVLFPATNGIMLTTGNLEDISVESGPMTSMAVAKKSYLKGGATVGPLEARTRYSPELSQYVQQSWWDSGLTDSEGKERSRSEGGAKWDWTSGGPWLTLFAPGDCMHPRSMMRQRGARLRRPLRVRWKRSGFRARTRTSISTSFQAGRGSGSRLRGR